LTALHPGVGRAEAAHVDLPVQRDEFGLPTIWASSLKGAIRAKAERGLFNGSLCVNEDRVNDCAKVLAVFGPKPDFAHEFSSSVAFLDAKLFAIPARSLKGVWLYVTSPLLLSFAKLYAEALGVELKLPELPIVEPGEVAVSDGSYVVDGGYAVINELRFRVSNRRVPRIDVAPFRRVRELLGREPGFAVVSDNDLPIVVRRSLMVQYRVRLRQDTKTVDVGPWSEEYIPPFTVFISGVYCGDRLREVVRVRLPPREPDRRWEEREVRPQLADACSYVESVARGALWIGGKETVGKGLVEVVA